MATARYGTNSPLDEALQEDLSMQERSSRGSATPMPEPSLAELFGGLVSDAQQLVHREVDLVKQEVRNEVEKAQQGIVALAIGAGAVLIGAPFLIHALAYGLNAAFNLPMWASYLIVGLVITIVGAVLLLQGVNRVKQVNPVPRETIESVKEQVSVIAGQATDSIS